MAEKLYIKKTEGKRVFYILPVKEFSNSVAYLDVTDRARHAINRDRRKHYDAENGPNFGVEILHAREYADYVAQHATENNLHKFNTRDGGYSFFTVSADV